MPCHADGVNSRRGNRLLICSALAALLAAGCLPVSPPTPREMPEASQLIERLDAQGSAVQTVKGLVRTKLETPQGREAFSQVLLIERPDRLRVEVLGLLGQPVLKLVSDGRELTIALPGERYYRGAASAENLERFTHLPLEPQQLVELLLGDVPYGHPGPVTVETTGEGYALVSQSDRDMERFFFDPQLHLTGAEYLRDGVEWLRLSYGDYSDEGMPLRSGLTLPLLGISAELTFSSAIVNAPLAAERFVLPVPVGSDVQPLP